MKPARRTSWRTLIRYAGTLLAIILMVYLLRQRWDEIVTSFSQLAWWRLLLAFGFILLSRFSVIGRWHMLLRSADPETDWRKTTRIAYAGLFATNFLPTTIGGDVVRLAGAIQSGFDAAVAAASLVVDRLVGMFGMALILPVGLARIAGLAALSNTVLAAALPQSLWQRVRRVAQRLLSALGIWRKQRIALLSSLGFTFLHMLGFFACLMVLLDGMGESMSFWIVGGLWTFVYFVTLLPISINGLGVQEVSIVGIFTTFGGISEPSALTVALIFRTLVMLASLPGAAFVGSIMPAVEQQAKEEPLVPVEGES
ncbi:MAG: UPF0104 family protein [Chloroflexi bacterium]|nr:MAG: UPF0104 family protein [Chloroflexota bacterium]MBL1193201.1 UPF0104 family protein [Chloroflexota bacterium]NOH10495.1 flippase-like domain-containing protein [Chloroflexota bacterium]